MQWWPIQCSFIIILPLCIWIQTWKAPHIAFVTEKLQGTKLTLSWHAEVNEFWDRICICIFIPICFRVNFSIWEFWETIVKSACNFSCLEFQVSTFFSAENVSLSKFACLNSHDFFEFHRWDDLNFYYWLKPFSKIQNHTFIST